MGRRSSREGLEEFNNEVVRSGVTYADIQKLETQSKMERIRVPKTVKSDGMPVYMTVAARKRLKELDILESKTLKKGAGASGRCNVYTGSFTEDAGNI